MSSSVARIAAGILLAVAYMIGTAQQAIAQSSDGFGVIVMAHGGSEEWNAGVRSVVVPLQSQFPVEIAFGMADAASLQASITALEARGVDRIAVVRLFLSAESFLERTAQILGLEEGAPARPTADGADGDAEPAEHSMQFWRVETDAQLMMSREGLLEAREIGAVVAGRARVLSTSAANEDVLILAHGAGDDAENVRWLRMMEARAEQVRAAQPFHEVRVATLREDWPQKREAAQAEIRAFVTAAAAARRRVIVVPLRVHGFGPYAEVLAGLSYVSDGNGLVPHPSVTQWIRRQAEMLR